MFFCREPSDDPYDFYYPYDSRESYDSNVFTGVYLFLCTLFRRDTGNVRLKGEGKSNYVENTLFDKSSSHSGENRSSIQQKKNTSTGIARGRGHS